MTAPVLNSSRLALQRWLMAALVVPLVFFLFFHAATHTGAAAFGPHRAHTSSGQVCSAVAAAPTAMVARVSRRRRQTWKSRVLRTVKTLPTVLSAVVGALRRQAPLATFPSLLVLKTLRC